MVKAVPSTTPSMILFEPIIFGDNRGFLFESYNHAQFVQTIGGLVSVICSYNSKFTENMLHKLDYKTLQLQGSLLCTAKETFLNLAADLSKSFKPQNLSMNLSKVAEVFT